MSSSEEEAEPLQIKVILLGDGTVGKTSIAMRFAQDYFAKQYKQTIGLDFFLRRCKLPGDVEVALQLWDIGGQSIGSKMLKNYISGAQAVLLTYDITNYNSFENLEDWYKMVKKVFDGEEMPYIALVANKVDMTHMRTVNPDKHRKFAGSEMRQFTVSAKTGERCKECFKKIAADLAGVVLSHRDLETDQRILKAEVTKHARRADEVVTHGSKKSQDKNCAIQ